MQNQHTEDVPHVEFMYLVFTCMPGKRYRRRLRSLLLSLCYVFRTLINSHVCSFKLDGVSPYNRQSDLFEPGPDLCRLVQCARGVGGGWGGGRPRSKLPSAVWQDRRYIYISGHAGAHLSVLALACGEGDE